MAKAYNKQPKLAILINFPSGNLSNKSPLPVVAVLEIDLAAAAADLVVMTRQVTYVEELAVARHLPMVAVVAAVAAHSVAPVAGLEHPFYSGEND
ncbi:hypothetical protein CDL15_Pgr000750 [Punica granatum]|uniref:Uncharacterized protein n=1 Tax=Punica granatum TaxID=22663 RepID=A0A218W4A7_PUNGR|nr:hypothetical protein CDL15_Pgr000750 [Punica granatum]